MAQWHCDLCDKPIERNVMVCDPCGRGYHMECLAADWVMQAQYDPLATPQPGISAQPAPPHQPLPPPAPALESPAGKAKGRAKQGRPPKARASVQGSTGEGGVQGPVPASGVPSKGCCPACQVPHT